MPFTAEEVELLLQIAREVALGKTFQERLAAMAEAMTSLVPATSVSAFVLDRERGPGPPGFVFFRNGSIDTLRDYSENYMKLDPMTPLANAADGQPRLLSDFVRGRAFGRDAFTADFLPRVGVRYLLGFSHAMPDGRRLSFAMQRERALGDFTDRERSLVRLASPDVARAVSGVLLLAQVDHILAGGNGRPSASGAAIFSSAGEMVHSDASAAFLVKRLAEGGYGADALLADVKQTANAAREGLVIERTFAVAEGGRLRVRLSRTPTNEVLVLIDPVPIGSRDHFDAVADRAGLTAREREVAALAIQGFGNRYIARQLRLAEVTVNFHLRNVYGKTGAHGRNELTALLLGGGDTFTYQSR